VFFTNFENFGKKIGSEFAYDSLPYKSKEKNYEDEKNF